MMCMRCWLLCVEFVCRFGFVVCVGRWVQIVVVMMCCCFLFVVLLVFVVGWVVVVGLVLCIVVQVGMLFKFNFGGDGLFGFCVEYVYVLQCVDLCLLFSGFEELLLLMCIEVDFVVE